ncbi:alpha/beta hydrolase fold protein [Edwardsiella piscicida]|nr:alpha/beta hydrolase fold protein [Edwardsiella piscicida]
MCARATRKGLFAAVVRLRLVLDGGAVRCGDRAVATVRRALFPGGGMRRRAVMLVCPGVCPAFFTLAALAVARRGFSLIGDDFVCR